MLSATLTSCRIEVISNINYVACVSVFPTCLECSRVLIPTSVLIFLSQCMLSNQKNVSIGQLPGASARSFPAYGGVCSWIKPEMDSWCQVSLNGTLYRWSFMHVNIFTRVLSQSVKFMIARTKQSDNPRVELGRIESFSLGTAGNWIVTVTVDFH